MLQEIGIHALSMVGLTKSEMPLSLTNWVSTARPLQPANEEQYGNVVLEIRDLAKLWLPNAQNQYTTIFEANPEYENDWNALDSEERHISGYTDLKVPPVHFLHLSPGPTSQRQICPACFLTYKLESLHSVFPNAGICSRNTYS